MERVSDLGEFGLIGRLTRFFKNDDPSIIRDFGDDAAFVRLGDRLLVLTVDALVEGVHFLGFYPPVSVGRKLAAVNASDAAAKAARPLYALVNLGLPPETPLPYAEGLYEGLAEGARRYGFSVVGGNTTAAPALCLDLSLIAEAKRPVFREVPRPGLSIFVSGTLGDSRAGLELLLEFYEREKPSSFFPSPEDLFEAAGFGDRERFLVKRHLEPVARTDLIPVVGEKAVASMDVSDGLLSDLKKLSPRFAVRLEVSELPLSRELVEFCSERGRDPRLYALLGGEDYELLVASGEDLSFFGFTKIGEVLNEEGPKVVDERGRPLEGEGFDHLIRPR